ncbi:MAG: cysteine hydrolase family protein [Bacteroidota bacterium]
MQLNQYTALLLVDIQKGMDEWEAAGQSRNQPQAEANARRLLDHWRQHQWPLFHIKHNSQVPQSPLVKGKPGNAIKDIVQPQAGETLLEKEVNCAFLGTDLQQRLEALDVQSVVIVGLTTDHCVSSTARTANNLGYDTKVVADATAAFERTGPDGRHYSADDIHSTELACLHDEFAQVIQTEDLL